MIKYCHIDQVTQIMSEDDNIAVLQMDTEVERLTTQDSWKWSSLKKSQRFMLKAAVIVGGGGISHYLHMPDR